MAIIEEMLVDEAAVGTGFGVGAVLLAPFLGRALRPAAKAVIKGGIVLYRGAADVVAEAAAAGGTSSAVAERAHAAPAHAGNHPERVKGKHTAGKRTTGRATRSANKKK